MSEVQDITGAQQDIQKMRDAAVNGMDVGSYDELLKKIQLQGLKGDVAQKRNIAANQGMQKAILEQPTQMDLTPLMAFADQLYGTKYAQSYKAPTSVEQKQAMVAKLQEEVMKATGQMSEDETKLLKTQLETMLSKEERQYKRDTLDALRATGRADKMALREEKQQKQYQDDLRHSQVQFDKMAGKTIERKAAIRDAETSLELALTDPAAYGRLPTQIAKLSASGNLTDNEIAAASGDRSLVGRYRQAVQSSKTGTITPENYQAFKEVISSINADLERSMQEHAKREAGKFATRWGIPKEQAITEVTGGEYTPEVFYNKKETADTAKDKPEYAVGDTYTDPKTATKYKFTGGDYKDKRNWKALGK